MMSLPPPIFRSIMPVVAQLFGDISNTRKIADEERKHREQLKEEKEKARKVMENLELRVRKSFEGFPHEYFQFSISGNFGRFVGSGGCCRWSNGWRRNDSRKRKKRQSDGS